MRGPFHSGCSAGPRAVVPEGQAREESGAEESSVPTHPSLGVSHPDYQTAGHCHTGPFLLQEECDSIHLTWGLPGNGSTSRSPAPIYQPYRPIWRISLEPAAPLFSWALFPVFSPDSLLLSIICHDLDHQSHSPHTMALPLHLPTSHTLGSLTHGPKCVLHDPHALRVTWPSPACPGHVVCASSPGSISNRSSE